VIIAKWKLYFKTQNRERENRNGLVIKEEG